MKLNSINVSALKLFNQKAEKLKSFSLLKILTTTKTGVTISFKKGEEGSIKREGPDEESIDASVLTIRFFIQDNEKCSVRNISEIYEHLDKRTSLYKRFKNARLLLNNFLDAKSFFIIGDKQITHREILETFIYGGLSHANAKKAKSYYKWSKNPILKDLITNQFIYVLANLMNFVFFVQGLNNQLLKKSSN